LLVGGLAFDVASDRWLPALWLTIASGVGLVALEVAASARWIVEVRGAATLAKIALILLVPAAWDHRMLLLLVVVVLASITSHMPRRIRHASLLPAWPRAAGAGGLRGAHSVAVGKGKRP
jgi:hypothetical protein